MSPFYRPRSNPDGWAVTFQCLDPGTVSAVEVRRFNGLNWEAFVEASGITEFSKNPSRGAPSVRAGGRAGGGDSQLAVPREALGGPHPWLRSAAETPETDHAEGHAEPRH